MFELPAAPCAAIHSPIREWLKDRHDSWLVAFLLEWLSVYPETDGNAKQEAVAVALYARLQESADHERRSLPHTVPELMARVDGRPARWAYSLSDEQIATLLWRAEAIVGGIECTMFDLAATQDLDWRDRLEEQLFEDRDNVESIRWVLAQSGKDEPVRAMRGTIDKWIHRYLETFRVPPIVIKSERIRRAALVDPLLAMSDEIICRA